ncbi:MAG TPA: GNAT family N-acetyltransferase [Rhodanobacteraceae bacterium]|nr:GNAT family N-acetyltransferase [Rhodanobacteraceae bacterium]
MASIRAATAADAGDLAVLCGQLGYPADPATVARRLADIAECRSGAVLVAEADDGAVVGWAEASLQRHLVHDPRVMLAGLVVAEGARNQGVGVALLGAVEAWSREQGAAELIVRSNIVRERAHRFYLREGFAEKKRQALFLKPL